MHAMTTGHFLGELNGEPIKTDEAGRSRRLLSRSISLSKLHGASQGHGTDTHSSITYFSAFWRRSAFSRSARRLASWRVFSEVCYIRISRRSRSYGYRPTLTNSSIACLMLEILPSYERTSSSMRCRCRSASASWNFASRAVLSAERWRRELSLEVWLSWFVNSSMRLSSRREVVDDGRGTLSDLVSRSTMRKLSSLICFSRLAYQGAPTC